MARMYEMNLIIRLQDRASARMRRISGDMSAMARHAQAQNRLITSRNNFAKESLRLQKASTTLSDMQNENGVKYNQNLAKRLTAERQVLRTAEAANRVGISRWERMVATSTAISAQEKATLNLSKTQKAAMKDYEAAIARVRALKQDNLNQEKRLVNEIEAATAAQAAYNSEVARTAPIIAAQEKQAARYRRGRAIAHGGSLAFMGGAVTVGLAGVAAGAYARFDVQARKAATQVGSTNLGIIDSIKQTTQIAKDQEKVLLQLARQYPATAEEQAKAQYDIFSSMDLGDTVLKRQQNGLKVLEAANRVAIGGQVDLATATNTLITVFNDFDPQIQNIDKNMAQLFAIVRFMRGGFDELSAGMNKLAPAAKLAHYSLLDVGAAFAVITQAIPSAAQASTAEARLIDLFGRKEFITGMERYAAALGKTGKEFSVLNQTTGQLLPMDEIIGRILKIDPTLAQGGPKLFKFVKQITQLGSDTGKGGFQGTIQMTRALAILITEHKKHLGILKQARQDTVEYRKSVKLLSDTADVKWKTAMNKLRVAWIQFGQAAMPILLSVLNVFTKAADIINSFGGKARAVIGTLIVLSGLLALVGGAAASAFGAFQMVTAIKSLHDLERALQAATIAEEALGNKAGPAGTSILGLGKKALKAAGWITVLILAWESLKGGVEEFTNQDVKGNFLQKGLRGWATQFKSAEGFLAGMIGKKEVSDAAWEELFNSVPFLFGKASKKVKDEAVKTGVQLKDGLTKASKDRLEDILKAEKEQIASKQKLLAWQKAYDKEVARARQAAEKQRKQDVDNAAKNLLSKYRELEAANKNATKTLLNGPLSGGPILGAFQNINQTLMGLGIKPIKIPLEFLMKDAEGALANFDAWRGGLKKLGKKLPKEMIDELQAGGIEKLPEILSLADASPAFLKAYVSVWKKTKAARDAATKADMDSTLKNWNSYGKDVAWQIVNGLVDSGAEAKLYEDFSKMITTSFAGQLTASMNAAVAEAVANWVEANPKPTVTGGPTSAQVQAGVNANNAIAARDAYTQNLMSMGYATSNPNLTRAHAAAVAAGIADRGTHSGGSTISRIAHTGPIHSSTGRPWWKLWATGGVIPGSGNRDSVPSMLTPGEVVLNKHQIRNVASMMGTANNPHSVFRKAQHFNKGGVVAANNYMHMKGVDIVQDPKTGTISVVNGAGVRYRKFERGQSGFDQLQKYIMMHPQLGGGSVKSLISNTYHSMTPRGLWKQGKEMYNSVRHPIRRLKSGGIMMMPGGRMPKWDFTARNDIMASLGADPLAENATTLVTRNDLGHNELIQDLFNTISNIERLPYVVKIKRGEPQGYHGKWKANSLAMMKNATRYNSDRLIVGHHQGKLTGLAGYLEHDRQHDQPGVGNIPYLGARNGYGIDIVKRGFEIARSKGYGWETGHLLEDSKDLNILLFGENKPHYTPQELADVLQNWRQLMQRYRHTAREQRKRRRRTNNISMPSPQSLAEDIEVRIASITDSAYRRSITSQYIRVLSEQYRGLLTPSEFDSQLQFIGADMHLSGFKKGGWVRGSGDSDTVPAFLTPGEFVLSKPMIKDLTKGSSTTSGQTTVINNTHNYNGVDEKSIAAAFKQQEFRLRHKGK